MTEVMNILNKKLGDSKFFQCIVRDYLKRKIVEKDRVVMKMSVVNK